MIERIKKVLDYSQLSTAVFADTIGISRSGMTHLLTGRNQPSLDVARKILAAYPEVSTEWLIMGMGEMLRAEAPQGMPSVAAVPEPMPDAIVGASSEHLAENSKKMVQPDLFGEFPSVSDAEGDAAEYSRDVLSPFDEESEAAPALIDEGNVTATSEVEEQLPPAPPAARTQAASRPRRTQPIPVRRDRHSAAPQERKLQKIVFFYDDHSFEVWVNGLMG